MLKQIQLLLENNKLEEAFQMITENENELQHSSSYWTLRGYLCFLINEVDLAISYYKKAVSINSNNLLAIDNVIALIENTDNTSELAIYQDIKNSLEIAPMNFGIHDVLKTLYAQNTPENFQIFKSKIFGNSNNLYFRNEVFFGTSSISSILEYNYSIFKNSNIIVPLSKNYLNDIQTLADFGVKKCKVATIYQGNIQLIDINEDIMKNVKANKRENTIALHCLNRSDSNVYAMHKFMPANLKDKYHTIFLQGYSAFSIEYKVIIPLIASINISGHGTFVSYPFPELMKNIEVGHGSMSIKASGAMDKMPGFAFSASEYKHIDKICVTSHLDMLLWSSFTGCNINQFLISGNPRFDLLRTSNGKQNLEKLLKIKLTNKKVIFNMPTFHTHENSGRVNGDKNLNNFIKIKDFDYKKFDKFLKENNTICIFKVHHAEEGISSNKKDLKNCNNIYPISNADLDKYNLDLYEILNGADILITDYSSIHTDFVYMNKPIVFTNSDVEEYRENRGFALEPYDYWTAGPKVNNQYELENEILKSTNDSQYYQDKRNELRDVFFNNTESSPCKKIWEYIDFKKL